MKKIVILLTLFVFLPISLFAVLPPQILKEQAVNSNEVIKIKVIKVINKTLESSKVKGSKYHITATVKVIEVKKSDSKLKKGDIITIVYIRKELGEHMVGPKANPILSKGEKTAAFLYKAKDNTYGLSARAASFNDSHYKNFKEPKKDEIKDKVDVKVID